MDLILWRHAEAEDAAPGQDDLDRRLTKRGEKQARKMAKWFQQHRPKELRILVSPAQRTLQTAQALDLPFDIDERIGPGANAAALLDAAGWPETDGAVMLVGHQPTLGQTAALILAGRKHDWQIRKGAMWWLAARDGEITLGSVVSPERV